MLHAGGSFGKGFYAFAEMGYFHYSNGYSDAIEGKIEIGKNLGDHLTLMLTTDIRKSANNGTVQVENLLQTGFYPNNQEWVAASLKANYEFDSAWGVNAGTAMIPIQFNYVGFAGSLSAGVYKKL